MNLSKVVRIVSYSTVIAMLAQTNALADRAVDRYDSIENKQMALKQKINVKLEANAITSADRKVLLKMMQKVNEHKDRLFYQHDQALLPDDINVLDQELNQVSQKLYDLQDARIAAKPATKTGPAM